MANTHTTTRIDMDSISVSEYVASLFTITGISFIVFEPFVGGHINLSPVLFDEVLLEFVFVLFLLISYFVLF